MTRENEKIREKRRGKGNEANGSVKFHNGLMSHCHNFGWVVAFVCYAAA